jgi:hypothetical protein
VVTTSIEAADRIVFRQFVPITMILLGLCLAGCGVTAGPGNGTRQMTVTPSTAKFGNVTVKSNATQTIRIANTGTAELNISDAKIKGRGFSMFGLTAPSKLAAGASVNFTVAFQPTASGAASGSISIDSDAGGGPMNLDLSGTGVAESMKLTPSASSLSFGSIPVGKTETQEVNLTNGGNSDVTISSASALGIGFSASGGSNVTLGPNQSVTLTITFNPKEAGLQNGTLTVASNGPSVSIPLAGTATLAGVHTVSVTWTASTSPVRGYFVYRQTGTNGSFGKLVSTADTTTSFTDSNVADGVTYFYFVTAVSADNIESAPTSPVSVTIPTS